jgi:hypothetical protein
MSAYSDLILGTTGLLAYWRLGDASGAAIDAQGTLDGTVTGATRGVAGAIFGDADTAYSFDGSDVVTVSNDALLQISTGTLELWFKTAGSPDTWMVSKHGAYLLGTVGNDIGFFDFGGGALRDSNVAVNDNAWHHAALVFESGVSNQTFIYLDGVSVMTTSLTVSAQGQGVAIGATRTDAPESFFTGAIDEVAIYSTKLSAPTIAAHYDMGINGPTSNPYARVRTQFELRPY